MHREASHEGGAALGDELDPAAGRTREDEVGEDDLAVSGEHLHRRLVDHHLQGRFDLEAFVSERIALDGVEGAFHKMERGEVLRSVVVM